MSNETKRELNRDMLDIETLGTRPGSVIFEIAVVRFGGAGSRRPFHAEINIADAVKEGLRIDEATTAWWAKQSPAAREVLERCMSASGGRPLREVLADLAAYFAEIPPDELWGNGSDFDNALVAEAYRVCGMDIPWKYRNNRCLRTATALLPKVKVEFAGTPHRALDDAWHQADRLVTMEAARMLYDAEGYRHPVAAPVDPLRQAMLEPRHANSRIIPWDGGEG